MSALVLAALPARAGNPDAAHENARLAFLAAVAAAHSVDAATISVQPVHAGLPDNPYDGLAAGPFLAFRADFPGRDPGPGGFAAADGRTVLARAPGALAALLEAAGLKTGPEAAPGVIARLAWLYQGQPGTETIDGHPLLEAVAPPSLATSPDGGVTAVWYVTRPGATGLVETWKAEFRLKPGKPPSFTENRLP